VAPAAGRAEAVGVEPGQHVQGVAAVSADEAVDGRAPDSSAANCARRSYPLTTLNSETFCEDPGERTTLREFTCSRPQTAG
jgi:hypothetical protein